MGELVGIIPNYGIDVKIAIPGGMAIGEITKES